MILDLLSHAGHYRDLSPRIVAGLDFLRTFDPATPVGRHPIDGDDLFLLVQAYQTGPTAEKRLESHERYIDIQYVVSGTERILYAPVDSLEIDSPYVADSDIAFYKDPPASSSLLVPAGTFAIFHPHDGHMPGCMAGGRDDVVKALVKVRV